MKLGNVFIIIIILLALPWWIQKNWRYANNSNKNVQYSNNNLNNLGRDTATAKYLLLAEFSVRTVNYSPRFFP